VSFILIILNIKCTCTILHWTNFYRIHRICRYEFNLKKHISVNVSLFCFISDDETCPVRTFYRYKCKLNKNSVFLFQRPKSNTVGDCWYDSVPVGHNTLGNMMTTISKDCQLSKIYTNHSLRATTVYLLDVARFPNRHMSATGHKAEIS
jgi:hypothetical protein